MTAAVVMLGFALAGLLVICLAIACHGWEMALRAHDRCERLERTVRLLARRPTAPAEVEEETPALAWWVAS